jgi:hypothetical protein
MSPLLQHHYTSFAFCSFFGFLAVAPSTITAGYDAYPIFPEVCDATVLPLFGGCCGYGYG